MNRRRKYKQASWRKKVEFEGKIMMRLEADILIEQRLVGLSPEEMCLLAEKLKQGVKELE